jgi:hypothetical protein
LISQPELCVDALVVLRAYIVAESPAHVGPGWDSPETWACLVRAALHWAGIGIIEGPPWPALEFASVFDCGPIGAIDAIRTVLQGTSQGGT